MPSEAVCHSPQYERSVADLVIMLGPYAPMFASELWTGLASVARSTSYFDWVRSVLYVVAISIDLLMQGVVNVAEFFKV